jgi:hypothetical protein
VIAIAKQDDCNAICNNGYELEKTTEVWYVYWTKFGAARINKRKVVANELKAILYGDRDVKYVHSYKKYCILSFKIKIFDGLRRHSN